MDTKELEQQKVPLLYKQATSAAQYDALQGAFVMAGLELNNTLGGLFLMLARGQNSGL